MGQTLDGIRFFLFGFRQLMDGETKLKFMWFQLTIVVALAQRHNLKDRGDLHWVLENVLGGPELSAYFYAIGDEDEQAGGKPSPAIGWPRIPLRTLLSSFYTDSTKQPLVMALFIHNETFLKELETLAILSIVRQTVIVEYNHTDHEVHKSCGRWVRAREITLIFNVRPGYKRMEYVDYTIPIEYDHQIFIFREDEHLEIPTIKKLFHPYRSEVWIIIGLCYFSSLSTAYLLTHTEDFDGFRWSLYDAGLYFYQALVMQPGSTNLLKETSVWKFVGLWWFFSTIIATGFSAKLISFITSSFTTHHHFNDLDSLGDMIEKQGYAVGTVRNSLTHLIMENMIQDAHADNSSKSSNGYDELMSHIRDKGSMVYHCDNVREGVEKAMKEKYVFIGSENAIDQILSTLKVETDVHFERDHLTLAYRSIAVQKSSLFLPLFNRIFQKNQESGLYHQWHKKVEDKIRRNKGVTTEGLDNPGNDDDNSEYSSLNMDGMMAVFHLYMILNLCTFVVFIYECCLYKFPTRNRVKPQWRRKTRQKRRRALFYNSPLLVSGFLREDTIAQRLFSNTRRRRTRLMKDMYLKTHIEWQVYY